MFSIKGLSQLARFSCTSQIFPQPPGREFVISSRLHLQVIALKPRLNMHRCKCHLLFIYLFIFYGRSTGVRMNIKEYGTRMDVIMICGEDKLYNDSQKT